MKLHLGSGKRRIPGFINVDIDPANEPDVVADCRRLPTFDYDSANVIYACHVLEHVGRHEIHGTLLRWKEVLKPGGVLRLAVPDLGEVMYRYSVDENLTELLGFLYGGQRNEHDYHKMGWDFRSLKADLEDVGFKDVRRYDRDKTEHADVDDYSASYLPHMDRNGQLMSLNVEARK